MQCLGFGAEFATPKIKAVQAIDFRDFDDSSRFRSLTWTILRLHRSFVEFPFTSSAEGTMSKVEASKGVSVGDILAGKYRVEKIIGMGGMGIVVAATHLDLREKRAIKLIRPDAENDQSVERFLREARAVVRLRSEHVAEVYDVGRLENGAPYIVMELLEGQDLSAMLAARGPLPVEEAVLYVTQACHALAEAHAVGIVHRDLKPGNLFVTRRSNGTPCVKVLDFGISKNTKPERPDLEMTGAKDLVGSPLYMAPEQMRSARKVDPRADVWALGAILYKLLTGRAPFQAPTVPEIFALTLGRQVRLPSVLRPEISSDLDAIILRCLDKQLQNRYPTAAELGVALLPHGPWEPAAAESANQVFMSARRGSVPPPVPITDEMETLQREALIPPSSPIPMEMSEPMTGLARSNKIVRSGPISSWSDAHILPMMRPGWLAFVVLLAIFSTFVGATIVAFVERTTQVTTAQRVPEIALEPERHTPLAVKSAVPSPRMIPTVVIVEASAHSITKAPLASASVLVPVEKPPAPKTPRVAPTADAAASPAPSAALKTPAHSQDKLEGTISAPPDAFGRRE
jgi:eukaryotic-like serine/threonine-protein kinase